MFNRGLIQREYELRLIRDLADIKLKSMVEQEIKPGDRVELIWDGWGTGKWLGKIGVVKNKRDEDDKCFGKIYEITGQDGLPLGGGWSLRAFKKIGDTMANVCAGDIITKESSGQKQYRRVLFVTGWLVITGQTVHVLTMVDRTHPAIPYSRREFDSAFEYWCIYKPDEQITELSMDEVAKKFGKNVDQIRIKKEG